MLIGAWILVPLVGILSERDGANWGLVEDIRATGKYLLPTFGVLLALLHFFPYHDLPRHELFTPFQTKALRGVLSSEDRVRVVDEVIAEIGRRTKPGDRIQITGDTAPMLYFVSGLSPWMGNLWPGFESHQQLSARYDLASRNGSLPRLLVLTKQPVGGTSRWPLETRPISPKVQEDMDFLLALFSKENYRVVWENDMFQLLEAG